MKKQIIALGAALGLVAAVGVGSTLAYLTAETQTVTNTFTVGKVAITLSEDVAETNTVSNNQGGYDFTKLLPGQEYKKAPVVTVDANSEKCYVFVEINDKAADVTIEDFNADKKWTKVNNTENVYVQVVDPAEKDVNLSLKVFETVKVKAEVKENNKGTGKLGDISVKAYAIQFLGFNNAEDAWKEVSKKG